MKRYLFALGLAAGLSSACTLSLPSEEDLLNQLEGKLNIDKDTALAYTELAMKQAALASSAITASVSQQTPAAPKTPEGFSKLAVTADQCVTYSDYMCTEDGSKCSYTEDYGACGADFTGKIIRTFEGTYETYKITVEFDAYAEKASTETGHYAFDGKSIMTGTIGFDSASLSQNTEGKSASYIGGLLIHVASSSTFTFTVLNGELTIGGTQSGTIEETGQTGSLSISDLKFNDTCDGPVSGTVTTTIDGIASVVTITGCGQGTMTVAGQAVAIETGDLSKTFAPSIGGEEGSGFDGVVGGTDGGSLLSGYWHYIDSDKEEWIDLWDDGMGNSYINISTYRDNNQDTTYGGPGDTIEFAYGTFTFDATNLDVTFEYKDATSYDEEGNYLGTEVSCDPYQDITAQCDFGLVPYELLGAGQLKLGGYTYSLYYSYSDEPSAEPKY